LFDFQAAGVLATHGRTSADTGIERMRSSSRLPKSPPNPAGQRRRIRYGRSSCTRDGSLLSYGPELVDPYRRAASYVDRILRGEKPGDLPVQLPTKFEMVVNLKTAKALGLAVPLSILVRADEVIE
jgi:hypothetical protein